MEWIDEVQSRYGRTLTVPEIRKGVVALSRIYVEERRRIERGAVFDGAGKRAAFACFYSPLHFLLVRKVVSALSAEGAPTRRIFDLGCGLAVASAAWASLAPRKPEVVGFEKNAWAAGEARWLLAELGLKGRILQRNLQGFSGAGRGDAIVAAYAVNELPEKDRAALLERLIDAGRQGASVLVIEPLARRALSWWPVWEKAFLEGLGRADEWRFEADLPAPLALLDRASGLDHRELSARSLFLGTSGAPR